ncbi:hypothetical protein GCM10023197_17460 [Gordonia humi]
MDGVAREAGVGKAALYRRWSDKKGLLLDALELRSERVSARAAVLLAGDVRADLVALAAALMRHFLDPGGWATIRASVDMATDEPPVAEFYDRVVARHRTDATAVFQHYVDAGDLSRSVTVQAMVEQFYGAVLMHVLALRTADREHARAVPGDHVGPIVEVFLGGARREP